MWPAPPDSGQQELPPSHLAVPVGTQAMFHEYGKTVSSELNNGRVKKTTGSQNLPHLITWANRDVDKTEFP